MPLANPQCNSTVKYTFQDYFIRRLEHIIHITGPIYICIAVNNAYTANFFRLNSKKELQRPLRKLEFTSRADMKFNFFAWSPTTTINENSMK